MTSARRTSPRIFSDARLSRGQLVDLTTEQAHYLTHVMRLAPGDEVRLFNGDSGEWKGALATTGKRAASVKLNEQTRLPHTAPDLWLCCAPIKKAHFEYMIEKATELGVAVIQPLLTSRTQVRNVNLERCRAVAIEAAEQSERLDLPDIREPKALEEMARHAAQGRPLIVCAETGAAEPAGKALAALRAKTAADGHVKAAIVTGPEGGFAPEELEFLRKIPGAVFIRLGPRILRADTAAITALGCWQALAGDWIEA